MAAYTADEAQQVEGISCAVLFFSCLLLGAFASVDHEASKDGTVYQSLAETLARVLSDVPSCKIDIRQPFPTLEGQFTHLAESPGRTAC